MNQNTWRQVRVFSARKDPLWYTSLLGDIVKPAVVSHPTATLFFSMYQCPTGVDDGDTEIHELPPKFLDATAAGMHRSIRVRFRDESGLETDLTACLAAAKNLWYSAFLPYSPLSDLGSPRFSPDQTANRRDLRARFIVAALHANCQIVLDSLQPTGSAGDFLLEHSADPNNSVFAMPGQSVLHMLTNPWVHNNGNVQPVGALTQRGQDVCFVRL